MNVQIDSASVICSTALPNKKSHDTSTDIIGQYHDQPMGCNMNKRVSKINPPERPLIYSQPILKHQANWPNQEWQALLSSAIKTPEALIEQLSLPKESLSTLKKAHALFPIRIPLPYARKIKTGDLTDPLLRQVLPIADELTEVDHYVTDPLNEAHYTATEGLIQKYENRALIISTSVCGIHCRYCFRRHYPYQEQSLNAHNIEQILEVLANKPGVNEVILSGGDPLALKTPQLLSLCKKLTTLKQINKLRFHTRFPAVIPQRIDTELLEALSQLSTPIIMVLHCNHPNEIDDQFTQAMALLKQLNITLLNQSVLLKGVNDNEEVLITLSEKLFEAGILPYYLHFLDNVQGAAHYHVDRQEALTLVSRIKSSLPGYLVPKFVEEIPGAPAKRDMQ